MALMYARLILLITTRPKVLLLRECKAVVYKQMNSTAGCQGQGQKQKQFKSQIMIHN